MEPIQEETQFNAGVAIALQINTMLRQSEAFKSLGDLGMSHSQLEGAETWMWGKFKNNKQAREEIEGIKTKYRLYFTKYCIRKENGKKISRMLYNQVKSYLDEYEKALIYWRDKFGYGMPSKEDDEGL